MSSSSAPGTTALRFAAYFPQAWIAHLDATRRQGLVERTPNGPLRSDAYLGLLVEGLKPTNDTRYAARPGRAHCFRAGSSMGSLIRLYVLCECPQVFGGAAGLSTQWIGGFERNAVVPAAALRYLRDKLPPSDRVRLWLGRGDHELGASYDQAQAQVDALMAGKGFRQPHLHSQAFASTGHNERAWRDLLSQVLHLLPPA